MPDVKEILVEDVKLKQELVEEFHKIAKKQKVLMILISICVVLVFVAGLFYSNVTRKFFFDAISEELILLNKTRDSLRFEKEVFYRIRDTSEHYVRPMYDTIK